MDLIVFIIFIGICLFLTILKVPTSSPKNSDKKIDRELEEEMENLELEEWQKELVREGRFSPTSFGSKANDDLDDNSYYKDDE